MTIPSVNLKSLAQRMEGVDSIGDYDVLVSYQLDDINARLAQRAAELGTLRTIEWTNANDYDDRDRSITRHTKITLGSPMLQFKNGAELVTFTAPFTGSTTMTPNDGSEDPHTDSWADMKIVITATLATRPIADTMGHAKWSEGGHNPAPSGHRSVVLMDTDSEVTYAVYIDFSNILNLDVEDTSVHDTENTNSANDVGVSRRQARRLRVLQTIRTQVEARFKLAGMQYYLAAIRNSRYQVDSDSSIVLQPERFLFTIVPGETEERSALCIWILLVGNPHANPDLPLAFSPGGRPVNPIPSGRAASVIFGHRAMATVFLGPSLKRACSDVRCVSQPQQRGMEFRFKLPSTPVVIKPYDYHMNKVEYLVLQTFVDSHIDGLEFNLNNPEATIKVAEASTTVQDHCVVFKLSYVSDKHKIAWHQQLGAQSKRHRGITWAQFRYSASARWTRGPDADRHPNRIQLVFTFGQPLHVELEAEEPDLWDKMGGSVDWLPPQAPICPSIPKVSIDTPALDYFLATNLLIPGDYLFQADDPAQTTETHGLMMPRDTILTGVVRERE